MMFADDGLLIAQSLGDIRKLIKRVNEVSNDLGMKINKEKSMAIKFNHDGVVNCIEGIKLVNSIKYLGVTISGSRNCFKLHKENKLKTSKRMSNLTYSIVSNSCNKVMIGKTYWESVVLPSVLYGTSVITWTKSELKELEREENKVCRFVLGGPGHVAVAALRAEMGMKSLVSRDMKTKLKYVKNVMGRDEVSLTKKVFKDMYDKDKDSLIKLIREYMSEIEINDIEELTSMSDMTISRKIDEVDERKWKLSLIHI